MNLRLKDKCGTNFFLCALRGPLRSLCDLIGMLRFPDAVTLQATEGILRVGGLPEGTEFHQQVLQRLFDSGKSDHPVPAPLVLSQRQEQKQRFMRRPLASLLPDGEGLDALFEIGHHESNCLKKVVHAEGAERESNGKSAPPSPIAHGLSRLQTPTCRGCVYRGLPQKQRIHTDTKSVKTSARNTLIPAAIPIVAFLPFPL